MKEYEAEIIENKQIAEGVHSLRFVCPKRRRRARGSLRISRWAALTY